MKGGKKGVVYVTFNINSFITRKVLVVHHTNLHISFSTLGQCFRNGPRGGEVERQNGKTTVNVTRKTTNKITISMVSSEIVHGIK